MLGVRSFWGAGLCLGYSQSGYRDARLLGSTVLGLPGYWEPWLLGCWVIGMPRYWGAGLLGCRVIGVLELFTCPAIEVPDYWDIGVIWVLGYLGA